MYYNRLVTICQRLRLGEVCCRCATSWKATSYKLQPQCIISVLFPCIVDIRKVRTSYDIRSTVQTLANYSSFISSTHHFILSHWIIVIVISSYLLHFYFFATICSASSSVNQNNPHLRLISAFLLKGYSSGFALLDCLWVFSTEFATSPIVCSL